MPIIVKNLRGYNNDYTITLSGIIRDRKGMTIPISIAGNGYPVVTLIKAGKQVIKRVDKLVAKNYIHNIKPKVKKFIVARDGNKANTLSSNLRWATKEQFKNYKPKVKEVSVGGGKTKQLKVTDTHTKKEFIYNSSGEAETALSIPASKIRKAVRDKIQINNFKFEYL